MPNLSGRVPRSGGDADKSGAHAELRLPWSPAFRSGPARLVKLGLSRDDLSPDDLSPDGLSPDGLSPDGLSQDGLSQDGLSQDGLSQDGVVDGGRFDLAFEKNRCCPVSEVDRQSVLAGWPGAGSSFLGWGEDPDARRRG
jgi:hypothetical protein